MTSELINLISNINNEIDNKIKEREEIINMLTLDKFNTKLNEIKDNIKDEFCENFNLVLYIDHSLNKNKSITFNFTYLEKCYVKDSKSTKKYFEELKEKENDLHEKISISSSSPKRVQK